MKPVDSKRYTFYKYVLLILRQVSLCDAEKIQSAYNALYLVTLYLLSCKAQESISSVQIMSSVVRPAASYLSTDHTMYSYTVDIRVVSSILAQLHNST
eukprot:12319-Heterococcus_DN1.PRE.3